MTPCRYTLPIDDFNKDCLGVSDEVRRIIKEFLIQVRNALF